MFLPNTDSFVLTRKPTAKPEFSVFLPNTDSFVLIRSPVVKPEFTTTPVGDDARSAAQSALVPTGVGDSEQPEVNDEKRRNFLKVAGVVGAGIIASQISPKRAHALIMGSSPTTGVVGVKNANNEKINPATEETVSQLLKTSDLTFDAGSLQVKVTSLPAGDGSSSFSDAEDVAKSALVDADRHVQVDVLSSALPSAASTETTLQTISFGGFKFSLRLASVGNVDYIGEAAIGTPTSSASWRIKKVDSSSGIVIQWAGTGVFDQVWDNHASLSYS
jgi:hypothetical protein